MKSILTSTNRVKALLKSYGGNPEAWPENERFSAQQCIARSDMLKFLTKSSTKA